MFYKRYYNLMDYEKEQFSLKEVKTSLFKILKTFEKEVVIEFLKVVELGYISGVFIFNNYNKEKLYGRQCACPISTLLMIEKGGDMPYSGKQLIALGIFKCSQSPIENFSFSIKKGHTPLNNPFSSQLYRWVEEFIRKNYK